MTHKSIIASSTDARRDMYIVYCLIHNDEVVYVGQSRKGLARAYAHDEFGWERIFIVPCASQEELDSVESQHIAALKPRHNASLRGDFISLNALKADIGKTIYEIKRAIRTERVATTAFNCKTYINKNDILKIVQACNG
jgi:hypothetical protein